MFARSRLVHRPSRRAAAALASAALVAVPLLAACSSSSGGSAGPSAAPASANANANANASLAGVTLRIGDQKGTGLQALLAASGQDKNLPYKISWSIFTSGPPMLQALGANAIDLGGVGDSPPIFAAAGGAKLKLVAAYRSGPNAAAILVPKNSPLRTPADLKGKTVAVAKGSSANYHLLATLKKTGLSLSDITPAYLQPAPALSSFQAGKVDAWAVWEPYITIAKTLDGARVLANGAGTATGLAFEVASQQALDNPGKSAAIKDLIGRITKARDWAVANNTAWGTAWAKQIGIAASVAIASTKNQSVAPIPFDASVISTEQSAADAFFAAGQIPRKVDIASLVDDRFNAAVRAAG